jgi:hypothetical protein
MVVWIGILVGALFAWFAVKTGFYETWAMLFNIIISVYLGIFLGPVLVDIVPGAADTPYSSILAMLSSAIAAFLILHCISYTFLTGQFSVTFPSIFNSLGAAFLGFLAGFLVWSFATVLICISPISQNSFVRGLGFGGASQQTNLSNLSWWCNLVHKAAASGNGKISCEEQIARLLKKAEKKKGTETGRPSEPNDPAGASSKEM